MCEIEKSAQETIRENEKLIKEFIEDILDENFNM